jgi:hypothetical protein
MSKAAFIITLCLSALCAVSFSNLAAQRQSETFSIAAERFQTFQGATSDESVLTNRSPQPPPVIVMDGGIAGAGACCIQLQCQPAASEAQCIAMGGVFLPGENCEDAPCGLGACCSDTSCVQMDAYNCITSGRTFAGAGISCLTDPCNTGVGACCLPDGSCATVSNSQCQGFGGIWLGPGANCQNDPCTLGACCLPGQCLQTTQFDCIQQNGTFIVDGNCAAGACDIQDDCPADSLYSQPRDQPNAFTAYVSEAGAFQRWDNFNGVAGAIDGVVWFGLDMFFSGSGFFECEEFDPTFQISFHEDQGNLPGPAVCTYTLLAKRMPTGISYQGAELNRYEVTLPTSCVITSGWISIAGLGDPSCQFLWMSASGGDQYSYCDACQSPVQTDDMSFCLQGTYGNVFGSCCNQSTGACADNVEIVDCISTGLRFTPDVSCSELNPPCVVVTGACCMDAGACAIMTATECEKNDGTWLGANTTCGQCPVVGACCNGFGNCTFETQAACEGENGVWLGIDSVCADCPTPPQCPEDSLFAQTPESPDGFLAGTSEESANLHRYENFEGVSGPITALTWWGLDLDHISGSLFAECTEPDPTFNISFHEDAGGVPGKPVCSYTLLATRTPTGILYLGTEMNEYSVQLPQPCTLVNGWVSIVGLGEPECLFLWMSSAIGDSWCDNCLPPPQSIDLAVCLQGESGGVFGACCDDSTGQCKDGVEITDCLGPNSRFAPDQSCQSLDPPCGVIVGACCMRDATCSILTQEECAKLKGNWLGANTLCDQCPCIVPCPPGAVAEGEQVCANNYVDEFNSGCDAEKPAYSTIQLGQTVCGTSGVFLTGLKETPDVDWYQVEVKEFTELTWTARAEFRPQLWIVDGNHGCPGSVLSTAAAFECDEVTITAFVSPGMYWVVIAPFGFTDSAACGAPYVATLNPPSPCPADIAPQPSGNGVVDVDDLLMIINNWGPEEGPADIAPPPTGNGIVDVDDLLTVINNWGACE